MRIILLVLLVYGLLYSLYALIQSVRNKEVRKLQFFKNTADEEAIPVINKESEPEKYRHHLLFHFVIILLLSIIVTTLALL